MIIGAITGNAAVGLASTVGALQTAFADRPGPYRLRIVRMLGTALVAAVTSGLAVLASRSDLASVGLLLVLAFGAALLLSAGPSATQVGTAAVACTLVIGHTPNPPSVAVHVGLLVFAGGAGQTLLAVSAWPLRRHRPERLALARLYRELADAARDPRGTSAGPPAGDTLTDVRRTFYGLGHDHGPSVEAYRVLLDEAERIRREITVLSSAIERLAGAREPILAGLVRGALSTTGAVLTEIADALTHARAVRTEPLDRARAEVRHVVELLEDPADRRGSLTRRATAARLRALSGQLRAAVESTLAGASEGRHDERESGVATVGTVGIGGIAGIAGLRDPLAIVRANVTPDSAVLRHAVRLAILVAAADLVVRLSGVSRGYWVALTILVVLRPDFGATLQRSVMRTVGTVAGLLAATALVHWLPGGSDTGQWWQIALVAVFAFGMRLAGPVNVAPAAVSLSALVVILLEIQGISARTTLLDRSAATLAGGVLAIVSALALPSWERAFVPARLADLLAAYRRYLAAVTDPAADDAELDAARAASRRCRTNAQASVDRARAEPVRGHRQVELGQAVLAHTHRFIHAMLAVDAVRVPVRAAALAQFADFVAAADTALRAAETAVRTGAAPRAARLRPRCDELIAALDADPARVGGAEIAAVLADAADRITNSVDTLLAELRRQLAVEPDDEPAVTR